MAIDSTIAVRRALLPIVKANEAVTSITTRIHGMTAPANVKWPFVIYGASTPLARRASCLDGCRIITSLHGFAKARFNSGKSIVETAEDHAGRLSAALSAAVDGQRLTIPGGFARVKWTSSNLLIDGSEADAFHCVVNLEITCSTG